MHLQSLELFGFKSFADKTVFNFHEGVTAIVGPNGCGKSNLLDAIKWVLGEQSAKSLRGGEMADVIFNGTDSRKPLSFAEVSLTFTDCASELNVDWHDVRVTRRVYRDGNSEYLLNKTQCRLKDIQNLFADTGVARSAYSTHITRRNNSRNSNPIWLIPAPKLKRSPDQSNRAGQRSKAAKTNSRKNAAPWTRSTSKWPTSGLKRNDCRAKSPRTRAGL